MPRKQRVKVFVSYARANKNLASRFMDKYSQQVGASKFYDYFLWQDWDIIVGEEWREELEDVLETSNLGLLLVSPAFLASRFIAEVELPALLDSKTKAIIPVMLQPINFERQDLRGLERHQIFQLANVRFRSPKAYGECTGDQRERFVEGLFRQVEAKLDDLLGDKLSLDASSVLNQRAPDLQGGPPSPRVKPDGSQLRLVVEAYPTDTYRSLTPAWDGDGNEFTSLSAQSRIRLHNHGPKATTVIGIDLTLWLDDTTKLEEVDTVQHSLVDTQGHLAVDMSRLPVPGQAVEGDYYLMTQKVFEAGVADKITRKSFLRLTLRSLGNSDYIVDLPLVDDTLYP